MRQRAHPHRRHVRPTRLRRVQARNFQSRDVNRVQSLRESLRLQLVRLQAAVVVGKSDGEEVEDLDGRQNRHADEQRIDSAEIRDQAYEVRQ